MTQLIATAFLTFTSMALGIIIFLQFLTKKAFFFIPTSILYLLTNQLIKLIVNDFAVLTVGYLIFSCVFGVILFLILIKNYLSKSGLFFVDLGIPKSKGIEFGFSLIIVLLGIVSNVAAIYTITFL